MTEKDILTMVVAKVENVHNDIEMAYSKGRITAQEKNTAKFYTDQLKYDIQKLLNQLTHN